MEHAGYGVLVVDDDTAIRQALVAFFTYEGYAVFEAPTACPPWSACASARGARPLCGISACRGWAASMCWKRSSRLRLWRAGARSS